MSIARTRTLDQANDAPDGTGRREPGCVDWSRQYRRPAIHRQVGKIFARRSRLMLIP